MYFLKKQVILIMVIKVFFKLLLLIFLYQYSYSNIIYEKNNIVITEFDVKIYQKLYKQNYNSNINKSNSLKDLVLINKLINYLVVNNPDFLKKIDYEILIRLGQDSYENDGIKNF